MACEVQAASVCKTWNGEGDALAGILRPAGDIEFYVDVDTRCLPTTQALLIS